MTVIAYSYTVEGTASDGQTWKTEGTVGTRHAGNFHLAVEQAQIQTFQQLTKGEAVYGRPGVGCQGPYQITKLLIERES